MKCRSKVGRGVSNKYIYLRVYIYSDLPTLLLISLVISKYEVKPRTKNKLDLKRTI